MGEAQALGTGVVDLLGTPRPQLAAWLAEIGVGAVHADRIFGALHRRGLALEAIPDLGRHAATIAARCSVAAVTVVDRRDAGDGTEKLVLGLADGALVEAVLVPMPKGRTTLCVSTQVGCAMACSFCATGTLGLSRHLTAGEIVAQVALARRAAAEAGRVVNRLVFMGMGEPLHNWPGTRDALAVLLDGHGHGFAAEKVTVSTVGLVDRMDAFAAAFGGRVQLALSLHAGTDATRRRIVPTGRTTSIAALRDVLARWPLPGKRALMVEYVVLPGVNDGQDEVQGVADLVRGLRACVNVIPFNPFPGAAFRSPTRDEVLDLQRRMLAAGILATVRWPRGRDAAGACGQLALAHHPDAPRARGTRV
jgi:23S rRNA (adenine2503-C2)-methyltransferase